MMFSNCDINEGKALTPVQYSSSAAISFCSESLKMPCLKTSLESEAPIMTMDTISFDAYHASESFVFSLVYGCLCVICSLVVGLKTDFVGRRHGLTLEFRRGTLRH